MSDKVFSVHIKKLGEGVEEQIYYVEAKDAREAFSKIDSHTGDYPCSMIKVKEMRNVKIYT